ncbi:MAG: phosphatidylserine decarboxylase [Clostridia bacterium]|nr:phosphatidylserine decarboxylase [Clostridia bacterium]
MRERIDINDIKPPKIREFMYCNKMGAGILRISTSRWFSNIIAWYLNTRMSAGIIKKFVKHFDLDLSEYEQTKYRSFDSFFNRKIRSECRPVDTDPNALVSPCDGKLSVFNIDKDSVFRVKGFDYTLTSLLRNEQLAKEFEGGICLIYRLTVTDYHRYGFFDGGTAEDGVYIKGRLHTVSHEALERRRVFSENCREYTLLHTDNFGDALQMEVGAMLIGRIANHGKKQFRRGEEKGFFRYGGSTVIVLLKKGVAEVDEEILENTKNNFETIVKYGERVGSAVRK